MCDSNYKSFLKRISKVEDLESLKKLDESLDRLWDNGVFTVKEFQKLDFKILEKHDSLNMYLIEEGNYSPVFKTEGDLLVGYKCRNHSKEFIIK